MIHVARKMFYINAPGFIVEKCLKVKSIITMATLKYDTGQKYKEPSGSKSMWIFIWDNEITKPINYGRKSVSKMEPGEQTGFNT